MNKPIVLNAAILRGFRLFGSPEGNVIMPEDGAWITGYLGANRFLGAGDLTYQVRTWHPEHQTDTYLCDPDYKWTPGSNYEVNICGMKDDGQGNHTYCDPDEETPDFYSAYVRAYDEDDPTRVDILDDIDCVDEDEAVMVAEALCKKYRTDDVESY